MKTLFKSISVTLVLTICLTVVSCTSCAPKKEYFYRPAEFSYEEEFSEVNKTYNAYKADESGVTYLFDILIEKESRDNFITYTQQILDLINSSNSMTVYISRDFYTRADSGKASIWFNPSEARSVNHIISVLSCLYGETLNYGLLWGMSTKVNKQINWQQTSAASNNEIKQLLTNSENRFVLDLTYGVFDSKFSSYSQIYYAKSIAVRLIEYIDANYGASAYPALIEANSLFNGVFENLFYGYLNEYLNYIGAEPYLNGNVPFRCSSYTSSYPVKIHTVSCEYFIEKSWKEEGLSDNYWMYDNYFSFNYLSLKDYLLEHEEGFARIREFLDYDESKKVPALLKQTLSGGSLITEECAEMETVAALTGTYAYMIFNYAGLTEYSWMKQGITRYCTSLFFKTDEEMFRLAYEKVDNLDLSMKNVMKRAIEEYFKHFEGEESYLKYIQCVNYVRISEFKGEVTLNDYFSFPYFYLTGLTEYLLETYGKDKYLECYKAYGDLETVYHKNESQIINEYKEYLYSLFL